MYPKILLSLILLTSIHAASGATSPLNAAQYLAQQGWTPYPNKNLVLPVTNIVPVMYLAKGTVAPSCGLLTQTTAAPEFIDILSPEEGVGFPQCLAINDVAAFDLNKKKYLVFEYINRDTREDFYREYFYVYLDPTGKYVADQALNNSGAWPESLRASRNGANPPRASDGVKRAKALMSKSAP